MILNDIENIQRLIMNNYL